MLQPLSLLTFNLDLLFQHHHLEADAQRTEVPSPPFQGAGLQPPARGGSKPRGSGYIETLSQVDFGNPENLAATKSSGRVNPKTEGSEVSTKTRAEPVKVSLGFEQTSPQLLWVQEKNIRDLPPPDVEEDSFALQAGQVATLALFGVLNHIRLHF